MDSRAFLCLVNVSGSALFVAFVLQLGVAWWFGLGLGLGLGLVGCSQNHEHHFFADSAGVRDKQYCLTKKFSKCTCLKG